jgi:hypothetical protein
MDYIGGVSSIVSVVAFAIFVAGVMRVFQMATTLSEIKDLLTSIKLNAPIDPAMRPGVGPAIGIPTLHPSIQSGEEMLRAALSDLDHPVNPASIELGNKS